LEELDDRCLLSAGALDPTFGSGGIVTTSVGPTTEWAGAAAVAVYPSAGTANDGKIVAAGNAPTGVHSGTLLEGFAVARYQVNGTLDASFGAGGEVTTQIGSGSDRANDVAIQADGKIVLVGSGSSASTGSAYALARYVGSTTLSARTSAPAPTAAAPSTSTSIPLITASDNDSPRPTGPVGPSLSRLPARWRPRMSLMARPGDTLR